PAPRRLQEHPPAQVGRGRAAGGAVEAQEVAVGGGSRGYACHSSHVVSGGRPGGGREGAVHILPATREAHRRRAGKRSSRRGVEAARVLRLSQVA
nr:hypothetical protein [Tanacetum cinerariifolium]